MTAVRRHLGPSMVLATLVLGCGTPLAPSEAVSEPVRVLTATPGGNPVVLTFDGILERTEGQWFTRAEAEWTQVPSSMVALDDSYWVWGAGTRPGLTRVGARGEYLHIPVEDTVLLSAAGPEDVWALVGRRPTGLYRWDGRVFRFVAAVPANRTRAVRAFAGGVWLVGDELQRVEASGELTTFSPREGDPVDPQHVVVDGAGRLFVYFEASSMHEAALVALEGETLTPMVLPSLGSATHVRDLFGTGADDLWMAVARAVQTQIYHFDGVGWAKESFMPHEANRVTAAGPGLAFATGRGTHGSATRLYELRAVRSGGAGHLSPRIEMRVSSEQLGVLPPRALPAELSCVGERTRPQGTDVFSPRVSVRPPEGTSPTVTSLRVDPSDGDVECQRCLEVVEGDVIELEAPRWFGYWGVSDRRLFSGQHYSYPGGAQVYIDVPPLLPTPGVNLFATARGCAGPMPPTRLRVFDDLGEEQLEQIRPDGPSTSIRYGWGEAAPRTPIATSDRFEALNVPVRDGQDRVRVELWGSRVEGGPEERLACEEVHVWPAVDVVFEIGPLRADGPPSCD